MKYATHPGPLLLLLLPLLPLVPGGPLALVACVLSSGVTTSSRCGVLATGGGGVAATGVRCDSVAGGCGGGIVGVAALLLRARLVSAPVAPVPAAPACFRMILS